MHVFNGLKTLGICLFVSSCSSEIDIVSKSSKVASGSVNCTMSLTENGNVHSQNMSLEELGQGVNTQSYDIVTGNGGGFNVDIKYKSLPGNRSYPANLDITLRDSAGDKKGYLFFALNDLSILNAMGIFGFMSEVEGNVVDVKFTCADPAVKTLQVIDLASERLISDTLIPNKGFQMIRPMLLPMAKTDTGAPIRRQGFDLDAHPFRMNYTLEEVKGGGVQFQYNLLRKTDEHLNLAARFYYHAPTLEVLRQGMFAGKFFDDNYGAIKLVYYPAMGQTLPQ